VTREQRLRAALPGAGDDLIGRLAALPAGVVSDVVTAAKQAHRRGRAHEVAVRRQRKADRRNHGHIEDDQQAGATARMLGATARRAGQSLDALAALAQFEHSIPELKRVAARRSLPLSSTAPITRAWWQSRASRVCLSPRCFA